MVSIYRKTAGEDFGRDYNTVIFDPEINPTQYIETRMPPGEPAEPSLNDLWREWKMKANQTDSDAYDKSSKTLVEAYNEV